MYRFFTCTLLCVYTHDAFVKTDSLVQCTTFTLNVQLAGKKPLYWELTDKHKLSQQDPGFTHSSQNDFMSVLRELYLILSLPETEKQLCNAGRSYML